MNDLPPLKLAIYYGTPSLINNSSNITEAISHFNLYDIIILLEGLENINHPDHQNTLNIITQSTCKFFGTINILNQSLGNIFQSINDWKSMTGIHGIYCDNFDLTSNLNRSKQNKIIKQVHNDCLHIMVSANHPDDVFKTQPGSSSVNSITEMNSQDYFLFKNYQINNGSYQDVNNWLNISNKMKQYKEMGPGYSNMSILATSGPSGFNQDLWDYAYYSASLYAFDAAGWGEVGLSSDNSLPFRNRKEIIGNMALGSIMNDNDLYFRNTNGGISINTNTHTISNIFSSIN